MSTREQQIKSCLFGGFLLATAVLVYFVFKPYLYSMILGVISAILFRPLQKKVFRLLGRETLSAFIVSVIAILAIFVPLTLFVIIVSRELFATYDFLSAYKLNNLLQKIDITIKNFAGLDLFSVTANISEYIRSGLNYFLKNIFGIFGNVVDFIVQIFIFILSLFYVLRDGDKIKKFLIKVSPMANEDDEEIIKRMVGASRSVMGGRLFIAVLQAVIVTIGFTIFSVPSPVVWGAMGAIASLLPIVGTAAITVPAIIYLFAVGHTGAGVGLLIWSATTVHVADNVLGPAIISRGLDVNPLLVLISVLGGISFFGPIGFIFGPLLLSLLMALLDIYQKEFQEYLSN